MSGAAAGCGVMSSALVPSVSSSWLAGREGRRDGRRRDGTGRPAGRAQENKGCGGPPRALYGLWGIFSQAAASRRGAMLALWPHSPSPPLRRLRPHYLGRNHTTAYRRSFIRYVPSGRKEAPKKRHKDSTSCESLRKLITRSFEVESRKGDRFLIIPHEVEGHVTYFLADHLRLSLLRCENST